MWEQCFLTRFLDWAIESCFWCTMRFLNYVSTYNCTIHHMEIIGYALLDDNVYVYYASIVVFLKKKIS